MKNTIDDAPRYLFQKLKRQMGEFGGHKIHCDHQIDLVEQGYDVAIRIAEPPDSSMVVTRLAPCHHVVCASSNYIERYGIPRTPNDPRRHNILSYRYQDSPNEWISYRRMAVTARYLSRAASIVSIHISYPYENRDK